MECHTLMSAKQRVQNHFRNKSTSDLTLLVDFYGCYVWHGLKLKVWEQKLFILLLGPFWLATGTYANVFNPVQK